MRRPALLATPVLALAVLAALAGCTPFDQIVPSPSPGASGRASHGASDGPGATGPSDRPTVGAAGCTITTPGNYQVADCATLTIAGDAVFVTAGRAGSLVVTGNGDQVLADAAGAVRIEGQGNVVVAGGDIGRVEISGDHNEVDAQGRISGGSIAGNDNTLKAPSGVTGVSDGGTGNDLGSRP